jgi:ABC-type multidrug transport system fused ATPase/permease subunit
VEETERPQFRGHYTYDESSGEVRKTYSLWKRTAKYLVSIPVLSCAIVVTLIVMTTVFYSQDRMYNDYVQGQPIDFSPKFPSFRPQHGSANTTHLGTNSTLAATENEQFTLSDLHNSSFWAATFFYPCMYGIVVSLLTIVFEFIALWLNDYENHRTQTTYMNRLILKVFSFQFVTIFTSLYYYAFFTDDSEGAFYQISVTIFSLMTVGQWWSMFLDIVVPSLYHRALLYRMKSAFANTNRKIYRAREFADETTRKAEAGARGGRARSAARSLAAVMNEKLDKRAEYLEQAKSKCWEEALQARYNNFTDYTSMVIQIGFVLFFSSVFPLCPLIALLNNLALIRFNALKICYTRQRPIAQKIGGIGVWEDVIQIMSVGGILTNCALYGFTSSVLRDALIPSIGKMGMAIFLFAYEHAILLFKYWLHGSIPTVHPSVQRARTRERKSCDRKSLLRSQATKSRRKSTMAGIAGGANGGDDGGNTGGQGTHGKKKPLRAQSSLLGFWFDMSTHAAGKGHGDHPDEAEGPAQHSAAVYNQYQQESRSLLADNKYRASGVREHKADCKSDSEDSGSEDLQHQAEEPPSDNDDEHAYREGHLPPPDYSPPLSLARQLLEEEKEERSVEDSRHVRAASPQPAVRMSPVPRCSTPSPLRLPLVAEAPSTSAQGLPRRSLSPNRSPLQQPPRAASPTPAQSSPQPVTRDQMISMIHANIHNSVVVHAPVHVNPVPAPVRHAAPSRRVSFVDNQVGDIVTAQPRAACTVPTQPQYDDAEDSVGSEDAYEYYNDEMSDLSDEDGGTEWDEQAANRQAAKDAWRMSFGDARTGDAANTKGAPAIQRAEYSPLQIQDGSKSTAKPIKQGSTTKPAAAKQQPPAASPAPSQQPAPSVHGMLSSWLWGQPAKFTSKHTVGSAGRHNALNLAPLGQVKKAVTPNPEARSDPRVGPFSPPSAPRLQEVTSPYAALLTPPVVIAPTADKQQTPRPLHLETPKDASPRRGTPAPVGPYNSSPARSPAGTSTKARQPAPSTPARTLLSEQVTSPFSYTGYTPDVTPRRSAASRAQPGAALNQENDRILANLQTGQLQQLLLLQQQQQEQQRAPPQTPPQSSKRPKTAVSAGEHTPPRTPGSAKTVSPVRSALAGGRKLQQQLVSTQMQNLGWQPSANPYEHLISPGGTAYDAPRALSPHTAAPPPAPAQVPHTPQASGGRRRRSVLVAGPTAAEANPASSSAAKPRRAPGSGRRASQQPNPTISDVPTGLAPAPNPFSFAAAKRPSRVMYD